MNKLRGFSQWSEIEISKNTSKKDSENWIKWEEAIAMICSFNQDNMIHDVWKRMHPTKAPELNQKGGCKIII